MHWSGQVTKPHLNLRGEESAIPLCLEGEGNWKFRPAGLISTMPKLEGEHVWESLRLWKTQDCKEFSHPLLFSEYSGHWDDHLITKWHTFQCQVYFCGYTHIGVKKYNYNHWGLRRKGTEINLTWEDTLVSNENQLASVLRNASGTQKSIGVAVSTIFLFQVMIWFW